MTKARDLANIISGGFTADDIPNIDASKITTGSIADARIPASAVSQHATSFDDNKIVNDISTLAIRQATQENLVNYSTSSSSVDVFQDATGIGSLTTSQRSDDEYVSSVVNTEQSLTINNSNYSTYISGVKGRSIDTSTYAPYGWSNWSLADNSTHVGTNSGYGTKGAYTFGSNGDSDQSYWKVTNNGSHSPSNYRFHAIGYKLNTAVLGGAGLALRNWGLKWRNGDDGYWWTQVYPSNSDSGFSATDEIWSGGCRLITADGGASNGNSYSHASNGGNGFASNSVKASTLWVYQFHYDNLTNFMFDELFFTGQANVLTTSATGNFISNAITAPSSTNKMGAIITYQDFVGTNALNTDIILQLSADNGSNFTTATLTAMPDFSTGIKMAKVNDLTIPNAGTQLKYKISFANQASGSKEARIRGVSLQY